MAKTFSVTIPIAGHVVLEVEADSKEDAIERALESHFDISDIETWEPLRQFNRGNVCYCPQPWEAEAEMVYDESESE